MVENERNQRVRAHEMELHRRSRRLREVDFATKYSTLPDHMRSNRDHLSFVGSDSATSELSLSSAGMADEELMNNEPRASVEMSHHRRQKQFPFSSSVSSNFHDAGFSPKRYTSAEDTSKSQQNKFGGKTTPESGHHHEWEHLRDNVMSQHQHKALRRMQHLPTDTLGLEEEEFSFLQHINNSSGTDGPSLSLTDQQKSLCARANEKLLSHREENVERRVSSWINNEDGEGDTIRGFDLYDPEYAQTKKELERRERHRQIKEKSLRIEKQLDKILDTAISNSRWGQVAALQHHDEPVMAEAFGAQRYAADHFYREPPQLTGSSRYGAGRTRPQQIKRYGEEQDEILAIMPPPSSSPSKRYMQRKGRHSPTGNVDAQGYDVAHTYAF
eukprot:TRINITY_DN67555_c7_g1_i1.p1 TRINITY_DN67555_c7_g1~~TRINITY_DN67555_c7_g1_i1.p1  ORF type:complete len:433 (+),score=27.40 TRINITY_DN67555_c7_g1_i1:142-1299(+)